MLSLRAVNPDERPSILAFNAASEAVSGMSYPQGRGGISGKRSLDGGLMPAIASVFVVELFRTSAHG
jgi:hypothetical protein